MGGMGILMDAPWRATDVVFTFAMWSVMMVGMMTPAATPMLLLFASIITGVFAIASPGFLAGDRETEE